MIGTCVVRSCCHAYISQLILSIYKQVRIGMTLRTISNTSPRPIYKQVRIGRKLGGGLETRLGQAYTINVLCMSLENLCFTKHAPWNKLSSVIFKTSDIILTSTVS